MTTDRAPTGETRSILRHVGIPFYYRHAPNPALRRGVFWIATLAIVALFLFNAILMPTERGTSLDNLRRSPFFREFGRYTTLSEGLRSLFYQSYVIALILSAIIAPLFSAFSLATERVTGTIAFLRLSPMPTTAIVIGKMFAPSYAIHILSAVLLGLGTVFGLTSGLDPGKVMTALMAVVMGCLTLHALGAFFACMTTTFKGFGAVLGLLVFGFILSMLPVAATHERCIGFLSYLSPWGAMNSSFWESSYRWYGRSREADFFGVEAAVPALIFATHLLAVVLLIWASVRKLDDPDRPALPVRAWVLLWITALIVAVGTTFNAVPNRFNPGEPWLYAMAIMFFGGSGICLLALLDHPFSREIALTHECERLAGRDDRTPSWLRGLLHSLFISALVCASGLAISAFLFGAIVSSARVGEFPVSTALGIVSATVAFAFLATLLLETSSLRFKTVAGRMVGAAAGIGLLLACFLAPVIHMGQVYSNWHTGLYYKEQELALKAQEEAGVTNQQEMDWRRQSLMWYRQRYDYAFYTDELNSNEDIMMMRERYKDSPFRLMWRYHPGVLPSYAGLLLLLIAATVGGRWWTYRSLRKDAEVAVGPRPRDLPMKPPRVTTEFTDSAALASDSGAHD